MNGTPRPRPSPSPSFKAVEVVEEEEEEKATEDVLSVSVLVSLLMEVEPGRSVEKVEVAEAVEEASNSIGDGSENRLPCPQQSYCVNSSSVWQQYCVRSRLHTHIYEEAQVVSEQPV